MDGVFIYNLLNHLKAWISKNSFPKFLFSFPDNSQVPTKINTALVFNFHIILSLICSSLYMKIFSVSFSHAFPFSLLSFALVSVRRYRNIYQQAIISCFRFDHNMLFLVSYLVFYGTPTLLCHVILNPVRSVGWDWRIHRLYLCSWVRPLPQSQAWVWH